tara:strand:- start:11235 stop:11732 length:498 start_codon:yes stop_codon:yes gene_type:complete
MNDHSLASFTMPQMSILVGAMMGTLGVAFFAATDYVTALIPLVFGVIIAGFGAAAITNPEIGSKSIQMSYFASSIALTVGLSTALFGSWTTTTSLIEQVMMAVIGGGHLFAGYTAHLRLKGDKTTKDIPYLGRKNTAGAYRSISEAWSTPEEKIIPATVFALVTD